MFAAGPSFGPFEKCDGIDFENGCELFEHVDGCGMLFALEHADIVAVDLGTISKFLLRQAFGMSQPTQVPGDDLPQSHAVRSPFPLIYCHPVN